MRREMPSEIPKMDAQLLFDQLGFTLDDEQYRDVISVADLFHFYTRQAQYRRFRPTEEEVEQNRPRALLRFAGRAILSEVHEKRKVWTWDYFAQRRDERRGRWPKPGTWPCRSGHGASGRQQRCAVRGRWRWREP